MSVIIERGGVAVIKTLLSLIHLALCVLLMVVVLLQHRKQGGFGGAFGGGTQAETGQWQRFTGLTKLTVAIAALFMLSSLLLILI
jgi:preprotein translocase subunit SecG